MRTRFLIAASTVALMAVPCHAQTAGEEDEVSAPASQPQQYGLEEIIVTAQRRAENLQRTPVAVSVVGGEDLLRANVTQAGNLQELVPSVIIESHTVGNLVFIRGVGNFTLTNNADPATAFNYDEVYIARPNSSDNQFYDLERVEVLKGPQGTLYGRNATAGAINVIPVKPKPGEFSGYASASYGNYEAVTLEGAVNMPVGDRGALRVSGHYVKHDGYLKDGTSDQDIKGFRVQLLGELTPDLTVRTSFDYTRQEGAGSGVTLSNTVSFNPATQSYTQTPVPFGRDEGLYTAASQQFVQSLVYPSLGAPALANGAYPYRANDFYGVHANIEWRSPVGTFTVIPAWRNDRLDFVLSNGFDAWEELNSEVFSLEARFASERFSIFDVTAGALLYDELLEVKTAGALGVAAAFQDQKYKTKSQAAYLRTTAHLTDAFRITGGVRFTHDRKTIDETDTNLLLICPSLAVGVPCPTAPTFPFTFALADQPIVPPAGSPPLPQGATGGLLIRTDPTQNDAFSKNEVTWRAAIEYDIAPSSLAYASIETGFRSGGFNPAGSAPYAPEYITAYTIGIKNQLFNNRVRLNIEGFIWDYKDQQLSYTGNDLAGNPANITRNIGRVKPKGIEAELSALVTPNTRLTANALYLKSKYDSFLFQSPSRAGLPNSGCAVSLNSNPALYDIDCTGKPAFNSPKWTANFAAQQTIPMGDYELVLEADTQYRSSHYIFINYTPDQLVDGNWRSNAQVSFGPSDGKWSLSAFVRNIENDRVPVFASQQPFLPATMVLTSPPRTYGARLSAKF